MTIPRRIAIPITSLVLCGMLGFGWLAYSRNQQHVKVARILKAMGPEDRFYLEYYFRHLLFEDPLAYVIFGDKPMAYSGFWNPRVSSEEDLMPSCSQKSILLKKGYELHKKYRGLFQSKNLIFVFRETEDYTEVALVNRRNFIKAVKDSVADFQKTLGPNVSGQAILDQFIQEGEILVKPLKENHALLGILLGYGQKNSSAFQRKVEILRSQRQFRLHPERAGLTPSPGFDSIDDEFVFLDSHLLPMDEPYSEFSLIDLPAFMVDPYDSETAEIKNKFIRQRKRIIDVYRQGHFLETTLNYLTD